MDDLTHETLARLALPGVSLIRLGDFEDAQLLRVKPTRKPGGYCWTFTPSLPRHVPQRFPEAELVTCLDADLFFYSSPEPVFAEMGEAPIAIHEHRFAPRH